MHPVKSPTEKSPSSGYAFCRQMGHDLRQPLHGLGMLASVLEQQLSDDAGRQAVAFLQDALNDMEATIDRFSESARLAMGKLADAPSAGLLGRQVFLCGDAPLDELQAAFVGRGAVAEIVAEPMALWNRLDAEAAPAVVLARCCPESAGETLAALLLLRQQQPAVGLALLHAGEVGDRLARLAEAAAVPCLAWPADFAAVAASLGVAAANDDIHYAFLDFPADGNNG